jgi:hypothetical protein
MYHISGWQSGVHGMLTLPKVLNKADLQIVDCRWQMADCIVSIVPVHQIIFRSMCLSSIVAEGPDYLLRTLSPAL